MYTLKRKTYLSVRVFCEFLIALLTLVFLSPFFAICYVCCSIDTKSSGLFFQRRIGQGGEIFNIWKFKTMREVSIQNKGSSVTVKDDNRVTKFGRIMRKFKIDELPQIINVLKFEMSFIGPRPTVQDDFDRMSSVEKKRQTLKPGMTGLAQINGNTSLSWAKRISYDLYYVRKVGFCIDAAIIVKTILLFISNNIETHPSGNEEW